MFAYHAKKPLTFFPLATLNGDIYLHTLIICTSMSLNQSFTIHVVRNLLLRKLGITPLFNYFNYAFMFFVVVCNLLVIRHFSVPLHTYSELVLVRIMLKCLLRVDYNNMKTVQKRLFLI